MTVRIYKGDTRWSASVGILADGRGHEYEIVDASGKVLGIGWTSGSRMDAEQAAEREIRRRS